MQRSMVRRAGTLLVAMSTACGAPAVTDGPAPDTDTDTDAVTVDTEVRDTDTDLPADTGPTVPRTCEDVGADLVFDAVPTWSADVAPILRDHCVACHAPEGAAPFPLTTFGLSRPWGTAMRQAVHDRRMPPPGPTDCGDCNTFRNAAWLTPEQIATVSAWVDGGMPEGEPLAQPLEAPPVVALEHVDLTLVNPDPWTPRLSDGDDHRCFVLETGLLDDAVVSGFQVQAGATALVHHAIVFAAGDPAQVAQARALDAADEGPGYGCYGSPGVTGATFVGGWVPGLDPVLYPVGTGIPLPLGSVIILQVHYVARAAPTPDQSTVRLQLEDRVRRRALMLRFAYDHFELPPGKERVLRTVDFDRVRPGDLESVTLWGIGAHMHEAGRSIRLERVLEDGSTACLADVTTYDFDAQGLFFFDTPVVVRADDDVRLTCAWDTRRFDHPVVYGGGLEDEMCMMIVYATPGLPEDVTGP